MWRKGKKKYFRISTALVGNSKEKTTRKQRRLFKSKSRHISIRLHATAQGRWQRNGPRRNMAEEREIRNNTTWYIDLNFVSTLSEHVNHHDLTADFYTIYISIRMTASVLRGSQWIQRSQRRNRALDVALLCVECQGPNLTSSVSERFWYTNATKKKRASYWKYLAILYMVNVTRLRHGKEASELHVTTVIHGTSLQQNVSLPLFWVPPFFSMVALVGRRSRDLSRAPRSAQSTLPSAHMS